MTELLAYFNGKITISDKIKEKLNEIIIEKKLVKGEKILLDNSIKKEHIFVTNGCLRSFYKTEDGKEHTIQFAIKNWWISDYIAIHTDELATLTVECLSESKVIEFNAKELDGIHARFPEFESYQRHNLERHVVSLYKRILNQLQLSAVERYDLFLNQYPDIEQYTRNFHIASYLGITQQSLSRIRVEKVKK